MQEPEKEGPSGLLVDLVRGEKRVTILICAAAVVLSIAGWTTPGLEPFVLDERAFSSEPWRLVSAHFVHGNFIHLYFNLSWIWFLGREIEKRLGPLLLLGTTLFMILGTSAAEHAFDRGAIGLSGVVYGMWAMLFVGQRRCELLRGVLTKKLNWLMVIWFFFCVVATLADLLPISNWGHGAGAALGALAGLALDASGRIRAASLPFGAVLLALLGAGATVLWPSWNFGGAAVVYERRADAAFDRSDWSAAETELTAQLRFDPKDDRAWWNLGVAQVRQDREGEATESFYRAFKCGPMEADRKTALRAGLAAQMNLKLLHGDRPAALEFAKRAVEVAPQDRESWTDLQSLAQELGDAEWIERARSELAKLGQKR